MKRSALSESADAGPVEAMEGILPEQPAAAAGAGAGVQGHTEAQVEPESSEEIPDKVRENLSSGLSLAEGRCDQKVRLLSESVRACVCVCASV